MIAPSPQDRRRIAPRLVGLALAALLAAGAFVTPATAATRVYEIDLGRPVDFVAQTNLVQCVGASMQMMLNIIEPGTDRTAKTQLRLQNLAREWSGPSRDGFERQGASVRGWTAGLNILGAGPYRLVGAATIQEALLMAARAIRETGKPVGLLMWRGRHAWIMSGFRATGDPLLTGVRVTAAIVEDPLYPRDSATWGSSPSPGQALTVSQLGRQFVPRRTSSRFGGLNSTLGGKYVLVLPYVLDAALYDGRYR
jgi:hypothetical protein